MLENGEEYLSLSQSSLTKITKIFRGAGMRKLMTALLPTTEF